MDRRPTCDGSNATFSLQQGEEVFLCLETGLTLSFQFFEALG